MSLYTRARKHIDMNRVKELRQKKITERIALQEQQYLLHFTQNFVPKHYDWRTGKFNENSLSLMQVNDIVLKRLEDIDNALSEGMTSKGFEYLYGGIVTYDIVSMSPTLVSSTFAQDLISASSEVTSYMFGPDFPGSHINSIGDYEVDSSRKVNVNAYYDSTFGSASGYGGNFTLNTVDGPSGASRSSLESALGITLPSGITGNLGGTPIEGSAVQRTFTGAKPGNVINFNWGFTSSEKGLPYSIKVDDYAFVAISGRTTKFVSILGNGDVKGGSFRYRLQPSDIDGNGNVKVSIGVIDVYDRLYNTTLRVNNFGSLYAGEIGTIGDTTDAADLGTSVDNLAYHKKKKQQPQQSFSDIAVSPTPYGPGTKYGTKPSGEQGFPEPGEMNKGNDGKWYEYGPDGWVPVPSVDAGGGDTQVARINDGPMDDPNNIQWPRNNPYKKPQPGPGYKPPVKKAKKQTTMVAHHEPQGEVLSEKKRLKSVKDIGNYPGKPSPLGFPEQEPPKMVNGYHPDLVDGEKVSQRFNRLDPISARAMPLTGNPHIDKKVRAAAKKPK